MTTKWFTSVISGVALLGVVLTGALPAPAEQAPDRNGPGVARVSIIEGSAVVQRGDSHTQTNAVRNAPMLPGDYISTGKTSRAELQFDGYTAVRLGGNVQARITNNDPNNRTMQLADGTVEIGMVHDGRAMQVETPSVTVRGQQTGDYRISIAKDGSSWITARRGRADVVTPQRTYTVDTGKTLVARGGAANPSISYVSETAFDSFDDFNAQRDQTMVAALNASPNLNPSIAGYDNLDAYGQWQDVSGYGQSWVPNEPSGWAPYRDGSWVWEGGYGWTWVGDEPWGWAPYHYGDWYNCGCGASGWAWLPPAYAATPAWSPALVGFFGFGVGFGGPGWGVSVGYGGYGSGGYGYGGYGYGGYGYGGYGYGGYGYGGYGYGYPYVGWVPLAPYETLYPWWPGWGWGGFGWTWPSVAFGYPGFYGGGNIVNITRITNINIYRNFRHGGATGATIGNFRHGTVSGHTVAVTQHNLGTHVGAIRGALPITPTRANLAFSHGAVHTPVTFSKAFNSPRFASNRALAARNSFAQQQKSLTQAFTHSSVNSRLSNTRMTRAGSPVTRQNAPVTRANAASAHENGPMTRGNAATTRANGAVGAHANAPVSRANAAQATRERGVTSRENAPTASWQRFNNSRGIGMHSSGFAGQSERGSSLSGRQSSAASASERQAPSGAATRQERGPSDSWGRYSAGRGNVSAPSQRGSYATSGERRSYAPSERGSYSRGEASGNAYSRNPYAQRSIPSYAHETPAYSRGSYGSSYSRGSIPSYAHETPAYSRGSYGSSYSRGSYPSYSRGSYSAPSYSRGSYSAPSYSHAAPSGGGDRRGGGRPPH